jgi:hypothetical protein
MLERDPLDGEEYEDAGVDSALLIGAILLLFVVFAVAGSFWMAEAARQAIAAAWGV